MTLAGLFITKLANLEQGQLNTTARELKGHWVEYIKSDKREMLSFSVFMRVGDKIAYEGENFDNRGEQIGFFSGTLTTGNRDKYRFRYSNREREDHVLPTEGYGEITFLRKRWWRRSKLVSFDGYIRDFVDNQRYEQWGWAATKDQCNVINRKDDTDRDLDDNKHRALVREIFLKKAEDAKKTPLPRSTSRD